MKFFKRTKDHMKWWRDRKIDWKTHYGNWDHPHRFLITAILKTFDWVSLLELGCGMGANLINIVKHIPGKQMGGVDINPDAIAEAERMFKGGIFKVGSADNVMLSDKSADVILTDMCLIYVGSKDIDRYIQEIKRLARNWVVLCEFHSKSCWQKLKLKFKTGYNAHNYQKLLTKHGFYDITTYKIPEAGWPGGEPQKTFGHIVVAKVPRR